MLWRVSLFAHDSFIFNTVDNDINNEAISGSSSSNKEICVLHNYFYVFMFVKKVTQ